MKLTYKYQSFYDLTTEELYTILALRIAVFVVEQDCPYPETDFKDQDSYHLSGFSPDGELAAYVRVVLPGISYEEISIGRVVTAGKFRGLGLGRDLMWEAINPNRGEARPSTHPHFCPISPGKASTGNLDSNLRGRSIWRMAFHTRRCTGNKRRDSSRNAFFSPQSKFLPLLIRSIPCSGATNIRAIGETRT